jgi:probable rRNA maturation factor
MSGALLPDTRMRTPAARRRRPPPRTQVAVKAPRSSRYAASVLRKAAHQWVREELSIAIVSDRQMRALNRRFRRKDRATDVLSFPLGEKGLLGDVVISIDTARRQAREGGWPLSAELRRLLAHGILHCRGYDHGGAADARRMAAAERRLLGRDGLVGASLSEKSVPTAAVSR